MMHPSLSRTSVVVRYGAPYQSAEDIGAAEDLVRVSGRLVPGIKYGDIHVHYDTLQQ